MAQLCSLGYPNSRIKCHATSPTEAARARKIKETWTAQWAATLPANSVFYDIGANIGVMSLLACEDRSKSVRAVAFEPATTNFPSLVRNASLNGLLDRIAAFPVGLGERTRIDFLHYQNDDPGGSLHSFGSIMHFKPNRSTEPVFSLATLCYALDDFVQLPGLAFPSHIKIDVDGTEIAILKGGMKTLADSRIHQVQIEAVDFGPDHVTSKAIVAAMAECGFHRFDVFEHNAGYPLCRDFRFQKTGAAPPGSRGRSGLQ